MLCPGVGGVDLAKVDCGTHLKGRRAEGRCDVTRRIKSFRESSAQAQDSSVGSCQCWLLYRDHLRKCKEIRGAAAAHCEGNDTCNFTRSLYSV